MFVSPLSLAATEYRYRAILAGLVLWYHASAVLAGAALRLRCLRRHGLRDGKPHRTGRHHRRGIRWAFSAFDAANWHPLTWLSHMLDAELFGLNAGGHHWTSVLIHAAASLTLFAALLSVTGAIWASALAAAPLAVHPLHVESVAWVAERKDVLSGFFWFLCLAAYASYVKKPAVGDVTLPYCSLLSWD